MSNERKQTIRQQIISHLEKDPLTVRDISQAVGIMEKDVYHHLASIEKTIRHRKKSIHVEPYYCLNCGFQFKNRKTFKKPGKCPGCKTGRIASAVFRIVSQGKKYGIIKKQSSSTQTILKERPHGHSKNAANVQDLLQASSYNRPG